MVKPGSSVFLFIGQERYLKTKALEELKASLLGASSGELDYKVFYGNESDARSIIDYAATFPLFASKRFVVIKDFEKLSQDDRDRLIDYLGRPSKSASFLLDSDDDSILKDHPSLAGYAKVVKFDGLADKDLAVHVRRLVSSRGKTIEDGAVEIILELQGNDLLSIAGEVEKLITFAGERKVIQSADAEELVGKSFIASVFDLAWATGDNDSEKALRLISDLVTGGKRVQEIIGLLSWHYRRLIKGKMLQEKGESASRIVQSVGVRRSDANGFMKQMKTFTGGALMAKLAILLEADVDIKRSAFDPFMIMEFTVIRLCLSGR